MAPTCKGLCEKEPKRRKYDNPTKKRGELGRYDFGYRRCSICQRFIKTEEVRCYCCSVKLKTGPYQTKSKKKKLETIARY